MKLTDLLKDGGELGRFVWYYPKIALAFGGVTQGVFLCYFIQLTGTQARKDGWIFKNSDDLRLETGLSWREQQTARRKLGELKVLESKQDRLHHRILFKVKSEVVNRMWAKYESENGENGGGDRRNVNPAGEKKLNQAPERLGGGAIDETSIRGSTKRQSAERRNVNPDTEIPLIDTFKDKETTTTAAPAAASLQAREEPTRLEDSQRENPSIALKVKAKPSPPIAPGPPSHRKAGPKNLAELQAFAASIGAPESYIAHKVQAQWENENWRFGDAWLDSGGVPITHWSAWFRRSWKESGAKWQSKLALSDEAKMRCEHESRGHAGDSEQCEACQSELKARQRAAWRKEEEERHHRNQHEEPFERCHQCHPDLEWTQEELAAKKEGDARADEWRAKIRATAQELKVKA